jgi:tetratricopeptide (TPR) repeat protein
MAGVVLVVVVLAAVNLWAWHHFQAAQQALRDDDLDPARQHISQCLRVWPRGSATHFLAARIARVSGRYPEAEQHLTECIHLQHGASEATQLEQVLLRAQAGELKEVEGGLWRCIDAGHPDSAQILETLVRVYLRESRTGAALACLDRWLEREPQTARAWHWRGLARERLHQEKNAVADYQKALELEPGRWGCRLRLARLLLGRSNPEEALPYVQELERSHPDDPEVLVVRAQCRQLQGEESQAIELLDRTLALHPNLFDALVLRGQLACQQRQPAEGEVWLRRAVAQQPRDPRTLYILYQCLEQQGKESEAAKVLAQQKAAEADAMRLSELLTIEVERAPRDPDLLAEVGAILLRLGEDRPGKEWLYRALNENENHKAAHETLLHYYESQGDEVMAAQHRLKLAQLSRQPAPTSARRP